MEGNIPGRFSETTGRYVRLFHIHKCPVLQSSPGHGDVVAAEQSDVGESWAFSRGLAQTERE